MYKQRNWFIYRARHVNKSKYTPPYKMTHKNHPCNVWLRESQSNYRYLVSNSVKKYTYRYGKIHKCQAYIEELEKNIPIYQKRVYKPAQVKIRLNLIDCITFMEKR